jgi:hypothetical protein
MTEKQTIESIISLEKRYAKIKDLLENSPLYKDLYKGMITIESKVMHQPDILFIGINPGEGAFNSLNSKTKGNAYPVRMISDEKYRENLQLAILGKHAARGYWKSEKIWEGYEWHELSKPVNNPFVVRMIDLLIKLANQRSEKPLDVSIKEGQTAFMDLIADKVMFTNVNPVATKSTTELNQIMAMLAKEKSLNEEWKLEKLDSVTKDTVTNFFRQRTFDLIEILQPKLIVCMGASAYSSMKLGSRTTGNIFTNPSYEVRGKKYPVVGFRRSGNWSGSMAEVAKEIEKHT